MKKSGNDTKLLEVDGQVIGVLLAADYTAEHEMGIRPLLASLSIDDQGMFLDGRSMQRGESDYYTIVKFDKTSTYYLEGKKPIKTKEKVIALVHRDGFGNELSTAKMHGVRYKLDTDIAGAWDDREFFIAGWTDKGKQAVEMIAEGMKIGDLSIWTGGAGGNPFSRNGLVIVRTSMVPEEQREQMRVADQARIDLTAAAQATGIIAKLDKFNQPAEANRPGDRLTFREKPRGYYALAPQMISAEEMVKRGTKHNVTFFLNPHSQTKYNHGWYTVEELEQWIKGKGPVIKTDA